MKKIIIMAVMALFVLTACEKSPLSNQGRVKVSLIASVPQSEALVKGIPANASSKQGGLSNLDPDLFDQRIVLEIWKGDTARVLREIKTFALGAPTPKFEFELEAQAYTFVAWSDFVPKGTNEDYVYCTNDEQKEGLKRVYNKDPFGDYADAFSATKTVDISATNSLALTLVRPLAKVRIMASDHATANPQATHMSISYSDSSYDFNALTGKVTVLYSSSGDRKTPIYPKDEVEKGNTCRTYAMGYFFPNDQESMIAINITPLIKSGEAYNEVGYTRSVAIPLVQNSVSTLITTFYKESQGDTGTTMIEAFDKEFDKDVIVGAENVLSILENKLSDVYSSLYSVKYNNHAFNGEPSTMINNDLMGSSMVRTAMGMGWYSKTYNFEDVRNPISTLPNLMWNYRYDQIYQINDLLATIEKLPEIEDQTLKSRVDNLIFQSKALRAYMYYQLLVSFSPRYDASSARSDLGVPLITHNENKKTPRNSVKEVVEFVKAELEYALDLAQPLSERTKIDVDAIRAILARFSLYVGDYQRAYQVATDVINSGRFGIKASNYFGGFSKFAGVSEAIWYTEGYGLFYASYFAHISSNVINGYVKTPMAIDNRLVQALGPNDVRRDLFLEEDQPTINNTPKEEYVNRGFIPNPSFPVYPFISKKYRVSDPNSSDGDVVLIRLSELIYIAAEAAYLNGNEAMAKSLFAGLVSKYSEGYVENASGEQLYQKIKNYKLFDLYGEGRSFEDYKRRGDLIDRTNSNHNQSLAKVMQLQSTGINSELFIMVIPQRAIDENPLIVQN